MNDAIPDPVMSAKISRLEEVSGRIFALAQKDPDKKAQLQKFMNYYLPTALKLLNTYAHLFGAGGGGHEHHRSQAQHRAQHGPAGDRL